MSRGGVLTQLISNSNETKLKNPYKFLLNLNPAQETFFKSECAKHVYQECIKKHNTIPPPVTFKEQRNAYSFCTFQAYQKCLDQEISS